MTLWGLRVLGLLTGTAFGFLLQRGRVSRYDVIERQLLMRDWTVLKTMATASAVGSLGVVALERAGVAEREAKPLTVGGTVLGAILFGTGLAVLGYCPGTTVAAVGEGRRDAIAGLLGMATGGWLFMRSYPRVKPILQKGSAGKVTLPEATSTSPWLWAAGLSALTIAGATLFERRSPRFASASAQRAAARVDATI